MSNSSEEVLEFASKPIGKLPATLNVLTILTFIGCALDLYSLSKNFMQGEDAIKKFEKAQEKLADAPSWAKKLASPEVHDMLVKSFENRIPIAICAFIATLLCLFGALEMRKQKKQGYIAWLIGELLPIASTVLFIGSIFFSTIYAWLFIIPIIFIILYTFQRKHLIN